VIDPVAALTTALPGEQGAQAQPIGPPAKPDGPGAPPPERAVALVGSAAALGALGMAMVIVQTVKRQRRRPGQ
jgi:hypothetical protein